MARRYKFIDIRIFKRTLYTFCITKGPVSPGWGEDQRVPQREDKEILSKRRRGGGLGRLAIWNFRLFNMSFLFYLEIFTALSFFTLFYNKSENIVFLLFRVRYCK